MGDSAIGSIEVEPGIKITKPTNPTKVNHQFIDWYQDSELTTLFDFNQEINQNYILYAI